MRYERFSTPDDGHHLSGYYDKKVVSDDGRDLCCLEVPYIDRLAKLASEQGQATIKIFDMEENKVRVLGNTQAWNFQQGCSLQFINNDKSIIFLALKTNKVVTRILGTGGEIEDEIDFPYYSFSNRANGFIGINQERYSKFRPGYSYPTDTNNYHSNYDDDDYIFFYDIKKRKSKILIRMSDLAEFPSPIPYKSSVNYMEHLTFSPCGTKFVFVHRFTTTNGQLYSRLFLYDTSLRNLKLLHGKGRVTHFNWLDSERILVWQGGDTFAQSIKNMKILRNKIKPLLKIYKSIISTNSEVGLTNVSRFMTGDCFAIIDINRNRIDTKTCRDILNDGHPSAAGDDLFISDTYPHGQTNEIILYSFDLVKNKRKELTKIKHPREYNLTSLRCDAHPKVNITSGTVAVDRLLQSRRSVEVMKY